MGQTFKRANGLGIWYLYDVIMVASGSFTDADGRRVVRWDPEGGEDTHGEISAEVIEDLAVSDVAEVTSRRVRLMARLKA